MTNVTIQQQVENVLQQLEEAYFDIPFENSDFQNRNFVMSAQITPARAYRAIGLRMFAKIRAIKEYYINKQLRQIDIEELEYKISLPETSEFDKRRHHLEILRIQEGEAWGEKLLNDAMRELECLHQEFQKFPRYTREQFEAEEEQHYTSYLQQQLHSSPASISIQNMTVNAEGLKDHLHAIKGLIDAPRKSTSRNKLP